MSEEERLRQEQEKQAKAEERAKKQREAKRKLAKNPQLRIQKWLKGINGDLQKISAALVEVKRCNDPGQKTLFTDRFQKAQTALKDFRGKFEKALVKGDHTAIDKAIISDAEAKVLEAKTFIGAWNKVKGLFGAA